MESIAEELALVPFLGRVPPRQLRTSAPLWAHCTLAPGQVLWEMGGPVDAMAVLVSGGLDAEIDGTVVGRVLPGEVLGEVSGFLRGASRSATLRAQVLSNVLTLPVGSLRTLRWQGSEVYQALLEQGLVTLVRRVGAANVRIAELATGGVAAPARREPSTLVRLWKALRPGGPAGACPPIEPLLRRQPGLATADSTVIAALTRSFTAEPIQEGEILFLEGEPGSAAWLVAEGSLHVLRNVRGDRAELLATLGPGSLVGIQPLVQAGSRSASCVAAGPGWLYRMEATSYANLRGPNCLAWREALLGSLATQIRNANVILQSVAGGGPRKVDRAGARSAGAAQADRQFQDLLRASGWLEGLVDPEREKLEVVVGAKPPEDPLPPR